MTTYMFRAVTEYLCHTWPRICSVPLLNICVTHDHVICSVCRNHNPVLPSFVTYQIITGFVTTVTQQVSLVEQELLTLLECLSSPQGFSGTVALPLDVCVVFCRSSFVSLYFFFWPLYCLFSLDLQLLITPLVSSNSSWQYRGNILCFVLVCFCF
jgi:hypothetical protein